MTPELPAFTVLRFQRTNDGSELGYGDVRVSGHLTVRFRLLSVGEDVYLVGPTMQGQTGVQEIAKPSAAFREALLPLFLAEYERLGREHPCRYCGATIRRERGVPLDARTLARHECAA